MSQKVTLYNLLISCPGDVKEEIILIELGNLRRDSFTSNPFSGSGLKGSPEEERKYWKIKELHETISKALEWALIEKAFSGMQCVRLALQNCGKAIDEDIEITFEIPQEASKRIALNNGFVYEGLIDNLERYRLIL